MAIFKWNGEDWLISKNWNTGGLHAPLRTVFEALADAISTRASETDTPIFDTLPGIGIDPIFDSNLWQLTLFGLSADPSRTPNPNDIPLHASEPLDDLYLTVNDHTYTYSPSPNDDLNDIANWIQAQVLDAFFRTGTALEDEIIDDFVDELTEFEDATVKKNNKTTTIEIDIKF